MIYLATPYSHDDPGERQRRYHASCRAAAKLLRAGIAVFNPLANAIPAVELGGLDLEHAEFLEIDLQFLRRSDEVLLLGLDGWEKSDGVRKEIFESFFLKKPVTLITEGDIDNLPVIPKGAKTYLTSNIFHVQ